MKTNKKGVELSMNMVIIMAVLLVVLIVAILIFMGGFEDFQKSLLKLRRKYGLRNQTSQCQADKMIGRKGTTDTLSFLIGVIIFLLIVIPIGIAVYHYMFAQSGMQKTLDLLIERTSDLEDGQKDSIIGYIDNGYILISFEKDQAQFGSTETTFGVKRWTCKGVGDETFTMLGH